MDCTDHCAGMWQGAVLALMQALLRCFQSYVLSSVVTPPLMLHSAGSAAFIGACVVSVERDGKKMVLAYG